MVYPTSRTIHYDYGTSGGLNDRISRIGALIDDSTTLATYTTLGGGMVTRINYPEPDLRLDLWGGTTGTFAGIDRFGRVIDQRWQNNVSTTPADVDRYQYGYDRSSNRLYKENTVLSDLSEAYSYDALNRLIAFRRGGLNGSKQVPTPTKVQDWNLDLLGNWNSHANADGPLMGDVNLDGTVNQPDLDKVTLGIVAGTLSNRWTDGDLNGDGQIDTADQSIASGNMSQFGSPGQVQSRTHNKVNQIDSFAGSPSMPAPAYDKAGNMTTFPKPSDPTHAFTATYDAWNRLKTLSDSAGTVVTYSYDARNRRIKRVTATETRHFYHTTSWQVIEERLGTSTAADRQYLWGLRYIDELICRDRDTNADGTLDERIYAMQDANFNVMALASSTGTVLQRFSYSPYGQSTPLTATGSTTTDAYSWNHRHQGGSLDTDTQLYHFRNREYHQVLGSWGVRDSMIYIDGPNLYSYILNDPINNLDSIGLQAKPLPNPGSAYPIIPQGFGQTQSSPAKSTNSPNSGNLATAAGPLAAAVAGQSIYDDIITDEVTDMLKKDISNGRISPDDGLFLYDTFSSAYSTLPTGAGPAGGFRAINPNSAWWKAYQNALKKQANRVNCDAIWHDYKRAALSVKPRIHTCCEAMENLRQLQKNLALRAAYMSAGCDGIDWHSPRTIEDKINKHIGQYNEILRAIVNAIENVTTVRLLFE